MGLTGERDAPDGEDWDDYLAPAEPVHEADVDDDGDDTDDDAPFDDD